MLNDRGKPFMVDKADRIANYGTNIFQGDMVAQVTGGTVEVHADGGTVPIVEYSMVVGMIHNKEELFQLLSRKHKCFRH